MKRLFFILLNSIVTITKKHHPRVVLSAPFWALPLHPLLTVQVILCLVLAIVPALHYFAAFHGLGLATNEILFAGFVFVGPEEKRDPLTGEFYAPLTWDILSDTKRELINAARREEIDDNLAVDAGLLTTSGGSEASSKYADSLQRYLDRIVWRALAYAVVKNKPSMYDGGALPEYDTEHLKIVIEEFALAGGAGRDAVTALRWALEVGPHGPLTRESTYEYL